MNLGSALYSRSAGLLHAKELGPELGRSMTSKSVEKQEVEGDAMGGSLISRWTKIAAVVAFYWFISISMVFLNKYLLSSKDLKLEAPIFITLSQCIVAAICFLFMGLLSSRSSIISFPAPEYTPYIALKVLPLSVVFVSMITFNNLTLKYLGVAFYNVGRSLTTVFNVSFSFFILGQKISLQVLGCCAVIVSGFLLGLKEEDQSVENLSIFGVACGVLASMSVALYAIYIKKVLPYVDGNIWRLQLYNNINAVFLLSPVMLILGEVPVLIRFHFWMSLYFWGILLAAGLCGIAIGYATSLQIKVTSPLTHNVSGTAKACAQTVLACVVFSQTKPVWWWVSNIMVLGGSSGYTYVRMQEMKVAAEEESTLTVVDEESGETNGTKS